MIEHALAISLLTALLLAAVARASRPHGLLAGTVGAAWQWWLVMRPRWLPAAVTGGCVLCTCFWVPGVPVAALAAVFGGVGWWACVVPFCVAVLAETLILL